MEYQVFRNGIPRSFNDIPGGFNRIPRSSHGTPRSLNGVPRLSVPWFAHRVYEGVLEYSSIIVWNQCAHVQDASCQRMSARLKQAQCCVCFAYIRACPGLAPTMASVREVGDSVDYWSTTHGKYIHTKVTLVENVGGRTMVQIKSKKGEFIPVDSDLIKWPGNSDVEATAAPLEGTPGTVAASAVGEKRAGVLEVSLVPRQHAWRTAC